MLLDVGRFLIGVSSRPLVEARKLESKQLSDSLS